MSRPNEFDRLDEAEPGRIPDKFGQFKAKMSQDREYREAYAQIAAADPEGVLSLPHPDAADTIPAEAMQMVRAFKARMVADPPRNLRLTTDG